MNEASQEQEIQENLSGMADYEEWIASQEAMPEHKRDGYAERMAEIADMKRKEERENFNG